MEPQDGPAALIVVDGAPLSHRVIGLVANGLPTVLTNAAQAKLLKPGSEVCVDGAQGLITACDSMPEDAPTPCLRTWRSA